MEFNEIKSERDLATQLNVPLYVINKILYIDKIETQYSTFNIPKKSGGLRVINAPSNELKKLQRRILINLTNYVRGCSLISKSENISHAFTKDKSIVTNAFFLQPRMFVNYSFNDTSVKIIGNQAQRIEIK